MFMYEAIADRRLEMLGEFAEIALSLARDLHQVALSAEDANDKARLAEACHRMGRGLRQSLALHARLEREAKRADREDAEHKIEQVQAARARRKAEVKGRIAGLVWSEYEPNDAEAEGVLEHLDLILDAEAEQDGFDTQDLETQVARFCRLIGYRPPVGLPLEPPGGARPAPQPPVEAFRSSA